MVERTEVIEKSSVHKFMRKGACDMPFHWLDLLPILLIGLAIFGPKALQSMARNVGKGVSSAKEAKDQVLSELPIQEISKVTRQIPLSPQQAIQMLLTPPEKEPEAKEK
jgi:Sec-independent protein translocase protein TatA